MKFTIPKADLLSALNISGKCISKNVIPALENYRFNISNNRLEVSGSNMEVFISTSVEVESDADVLLIVPQGRIAGLIKELPDVPLQFEVEERNNNLGSFYNLTIKVGKGVYVIPCENGKDFPVMETPDAVNFTITRDSLIAGIAKTLFAVSNDELRPNITGVLFELEETQLTCTATDTHVLSTTTCPMDLNIVKRVIVPKNMLQILKSMPIEESVSVSFNDRIISMVINESTVIKAHLIDDKYPDYTAIIPVKTSIVVQVNRLELLFSVRRVSQFSHEIIRGVDLEITSDGIKVCSKNDSNEEAAEEIEGELRGEPIEISFNAAKLLSILNLMESESVFIYMNASNKPVVIKESDNIPNPRQNLMLIMPLYRIPK